MNREDKFIEYLGTLSNDHNSELLENITTGFKTLVEYQIGGSPAEKVSDIMESEDEVENDGDSVLEEIASNPESLVEDLGSDEDTNASSTVEPVLEYVDAIDGAAAATGVLTQPILKEVDVMVEKKIQHMSQMIDRQKLVDSPEQKQKYLDHMRGQLWRDNLLERGIDPNKAKGLIPSLNESIESADIALLDFVDTAFKLLVVD